MLFRCSDTTTRNHWRSFQHHPWSVNPSRYNCGAATGMEVAIEVCQDRTNWNCLCQSCTHSWRCMQITVIVCYIYVLLVFKCEFWSEKNRGSYSHRHLTFIKGTVIAVITKQDWSNHAVIVILISHSKYGTLIINFCDFLNTRTNCCLNNLKSFVPNALMNCSGKLKKV